MSKTGLAGLILFVLLLVPVPAWTDLNQPKQVPDFSLWDIHGDKISLSSLKGKVVLINFWATWCPPCIRELPSMSALKKSFSDRPFEILAINMGEDLQTIQRFVEENDLDPGFPLLVDSEAGVADIFGVTSLPASIVLDKNGMAVFGGVGERDWNDPQVRNEFLPLFE